MLAGQYAFAAGELQPAAAHFRMSATACADDPACASDHLTSRCMLALTCLAAAQVGNTFWP